MRSKLFAILLTTVILTGCGSSSSGSSDSTETSADTSAAQEKSSGSQTEEEETEKETEKKTKLPRQQKPRPKKRILQRSPLPKGLLISGICAGETQWKPLKKLSPESLSRQMTED